MQPTTNAFVPALPLSRSPFTPPSTTPRTTPRPARYTAKLPPLPAFGNEREGVPPVWDGVRRVVNASAISLTLLLAGTGVKPSSRFTLRPAVAEAATVKDTSSGDVEAAAMTLGAVTIGGLVMRAIIASRRDEEKEKKKLEEECKRLEEEEEDRQRRAERRKLESVGDELADEFMERVRGMERRIASGEGRGTGSAVLERGDDEEGGEGGDVGEDQREMLKRMWEMSDGDGKGEKK